MCMRSNWKFVFIFSFKTRIHATPQLQTVPVRDLHGHCWNFAQLTLTYQNCKQIGGQLLIYFAQLNGSNFIFFRLGLFEQVGVKWVYSADTCHETKFVPLQSASVPWNGSGGFTNLGFNLFFLVSDWPNCATAVCATDNAAVAVWVTCCRSNVTRTTATTVTKVNRPSPDVDS